MAVVAGMAVAAIAPLALRGLGWVGAFNWVGFLGQVDFSKWLVEQSPLSNPLTWIGRSFGSDDVVADAPVLAIGLAAIPFAFGLAGDIARVAHDRYFAGYDHDLLAPLPDMIRAFDPLRGPVVSPEGEGPHVPMPWIGYDYERRERRRQLLEFGRKATPDAETAWQLSDGESHLRQMDEQIALRQELDAFVTDGTGPPDGRWRGVPATVFAWTILAGRPGSGKTRLAVQLGYSFEGRTESGQHDPNRRRGAWIWFRRSILRLPTRESDCWHVGWLKPGQMEVTDPKGGISYTDYREGAVVSPAIRAEILNWRPGAPTLLILDDPLPLDATMIIDALVAGSVQYRHPVRLLVVNQTMIAEIESRDCGPRSRGSGPLALWNENRLHRLDFDRLRGTGLLPPGEFSSERRKRFLRVTEGNPLLCEIGLAWLRDEYRQMKRDGDDKLKDMTREALLSHRVVRIVRGLERAGLGEIDRLLALAAATLAGEGAPTVRRVALGSEAPLTPRGRIEAEFKTTFDNDALRRAFPDPDDDFDVNLPRIRPEMIGDAFVARVMERAGEDARNRVVRLAFQIHPAGMQRAVLRILSITPEPDGPQKLRQTLQDPANQPDGLLSPAKVCLALAEASFLVPRLRWDAGETHRSRTTEQEFIDALARVPADQTAEVLDCVLGMLEGQDSRTVPRAGPALYVIANVLQQMRTTGHSPGLDDMIAYADRWIAAARRWYGGGGIGSEPYAYDDLWKHAIERNGVLSTDQHDAVEKLLARAMSGGFPASICGQLGGLGRALMAISDDSQTRLMGLRCELAYSRLCGNPPVSDLARDLMDKLENDKDATIEKRLARATVAWWLSGAAETAMTGIEEAIRLLEDLADERAWMLKTELLRALCSPDRLQEISDRLRTIPADISRAIGRLIEENKLSFLGAVYGDILLNPGVPPSMLEFNDIIVQFGINSTSSVKGRAWLFMQADQINRNEIFSESDPEIVSQRVREIDKFAARFAGERQAEYSRLIAWGRELRQLRTQDEAADLLDYIDTIALPFQGDREFWIAQAVARLNASRIAIDVGSKLVDLCIRWLDEHKLDRRLQGDPEAVSHQVAILSNAVFAHRRETSIAMQHAERADYDARRHMQNSLYGGKIAVSVCAAWRYLALEDVRSLAAFHAAGRAEAWAARFPLNADVQDEIDVIRKARHDANVEPFIAPAIWPERNDWVTAGAYDVRIDWKLMGPLPH